MPAFPVPTVLAVAPPPPATVAAAPAPAPPPVPVSAVAPPAPPATPRKISSHEAIWGRPVVRFGYAAIPSILLQGQRRLGLNNTQAMICIHLLDYWHHEDRRPFPSKRDLARRMGVTEKTIQTNISALEKAGIIRREYRKTASGDFNSNIYHLDGLITKVREIEPGFTAERQLRRENRSKLQSPGGLEKKPKSAE
ncbi:TPA: helix-turn-helix domain-containing protein [Stenotrophomonas maltophilia]|uniref:helix-turn-helix domain-containing protein n=1 Tax=Stenotrophomonas maltophilia TaxID=40324 RepID=UPI0029847703|nr:helix-turn-helix domain-containing protein [Stenotrophomonas maltophilia]HDS1131771.1 helix-turn-helix domain-containing protein [Stenotrophomonas maltophilia]HDS1158998.1 helix-turn-helix domain-containing protein [Stenotrophomonas maltophilia]HDS1168254.1 helix-turn-helix domain-containing protein [Stenotrophomonas maltophilia]HDS1172989.1 helix-turn-helix domain-containing protein [Stenotrophomonas maltophilia]HDS1177729.1 helix-turn-helix domain-containing protein [Stenotrophomonas malt